MKKILSSKFFDRGVLAVCPELLGKYLVINRGWKEVWFMITEIEAYDGQEDLACHARFGKTDRNAVMFGHPEHWYVYLCYGMYWMLNIVTGPWKHPSAILIRAVKSSTLKGTPSFIKEDKLDGPGKITKNLWIDKRFNWKKADKKSWLRIEDRWVIVKRYKTDKRIGVDYAGRWAKKKWRFILVNSQ